MPPQFIEEAGGSAFSHNGEGEELGKEEQLDD